MAVLVGETAVEVAPVAVVVDAAHRVVAHQVAAHQVAADVARGGEVVAASGVPTVATIRAVTVRLRVVATRVSRAKVWDVTQVSERTTAAAGEAGEAEAGAVVGAEVALLDAAEEVARGRRWRRRERPMMTSHPRPNRVRNPSRLTH